MLFFVISGIINAATSFFLGLFVLLKNRKTGKFVTFIVFCLAITIWNVGYVFWQLSSRPTDAIFWCKFLMAGTILLPIAYFHHICELLNLVIKKRLFILFGYALAVLFIILNIFSFLIVGVDKKLFFRFWPIQGPLFNIFTFLFLSMFSYSLVLILKAFRLASGTKKNQLKIILVGTIVGCLGGGTNFFLWYNIPIPPILHPLITVYIILIAYAIVKYRLMDMNVALTRTSIFISVYSLVLGIPFALAFGLRSQLISLIGPNWWMVPLVCSTVLATVGPFIYFYIEKKAEEKLFQEQRRYQNTLRQASAGMGRIKDLNRLVNLIVHIVTRTVRLEHALVYLIDSQQQKYLLKSWRSRDVRFSPIPEIDCNSPIVKELLNSRNPIVYDEIKQRTEDYGDLNLARLEGALMELSAALLVPSFVEDRLLAIIVLGKKESGSLYTEDDLNVFSILANQAALAIENAQFYEDMKVTHEQLFKAEKMATIGTMADGLSHQINNRLHALGFIASDVLDTIKMKKDLPMSAEFKEMLVDIEHGLTRIQENVTQGGEIVRGLLKYTRKGEEGFAAVDLNQLLDSAVEMTQFKIKSGEMNILREFSADIPKIKGNFTQLQEVFFNLIDNAYDAMIQRKNELKEPGYEPTIKVSTENSNNGHLVISVHDNGIGIKGDDKNKLFTPFFTTKLSSKKGTGLGLYVIRKLIEENHGGKVVYESKYQEGTRVTLDLPIYSAS